MTDSRPLSDLASKAGRLLEARKLTLATAESCTGGWVSMEITAIAGSSGWFDRGFVTYSNDAKRELLGVSEQTLAAHGAVSEAVAREMAEGALGRSKARVSLAITGVAGPAGGSPDKPVGTVCVAWSRHGAPTRALTYRFSGDRDSVRRQSVAAALSGLVDILEESP